MVYQNMWDKVRIGTWTPHSSNNEIRKSNPSILDMVDVIGTGVRFTPSTKLHRRGQCVFEVVMRGWTNLRFKVGVFY